MSLRVLHLVHWLTRGGIERWLLDMIRAADRNVLTMDVLCRGPNTGVLAPQARAAGATVHHIPLGFSHSRFGRKLGSLLKEERYDVLHVHAGSFAGYPSKVASRAGVAPVVTIHNTRFGFETAGAVSLLGPLRRAYTVRSFRTADQYCRAVIGCSEASLEAMTSLSGASRDARYGVIPYGTAMPPGRDAERAARTRSELGIPADAPVAIHVGVMRDAKNHAGLIRIAGRIRSAVPDFRLLLVGDGALRPSVEQQIGEMKLKGAVQVLGPRDDVERLLEAADVMIFPSLWEGLPIAVIEAQMKGLPIVGSDIPPLHEATDAGRTSLLFPVECEREMADAAIALLNDPARRQAMSLAATAFVIDRFSIRSTVARYFEIYRRIAGR